MVEVWVDNTALYFIIDDTAAAATTMQPATVQGNNNQFTIVVFSEMVGHTI